MEETTFWTAGRMAGAISAGEISSAELVEAHLARIHALNPRINAVVTLDEAGARARAMDADRAVAAGEPLGPLHGVPITVKDVFATAGMRTTNGYRGTAHGVPDRDAPTVARLKDAGAIILGKTNVPELSWDWQCHSPIFGRTNNPWDLGRGPGGSSGGSAAAVAAGLAPLELGSDAAGSLRVPAHFCGVYTIRPTEHRVSNVGHGRIPGFPRTTRHITSCGPLARDMGDLRLALGIIAGPDGTDADLPPVPFTPPSGAPREGGIRFGLLEDWGIPFDEPTRRGLARAVGALERAGCVVERPALPFDAAEASQLWGEIIGAEMGASMGWLRHGWRVLHRLRLGPAAMTDGYSIGLRLDLPRYLRALERRDELVALLDALLAHYDACFAPVASTPAFPHQRMGRPLLVDGRPTRYAEANGRVVTALALTGNPVVVIPAAVEGGLPVGLQLIGPRWSDAALLETAAHADRIVGGYQRPPAPFGTP